MNVWDEKMNRTRESMRVMTMARNALEDIFKYALSVGLTPESFCFVVNEAAMTISLKHAVENQIWERQKDRQ